MEVKLEKWREIVNYARQEYYELNYYTTVQLLTIRRELRAASDIAPNVLFLLQSISSQITIGDVHDVVKTFAEAMSESMMQADLSKVADPQPESQTSLDTIEDPTESSPPKLFSDMPKLTESELTDDQREILEFVTSRLDCSKLIVLKAFEYYQEKCVDRYDFLRWCGEKLEEYDFKEESDYDDQEEDAILMSSVDSVSENGKYQLSK